MSASFIPTPLDVSGSLDIIQQGPMTTVNWGRFWSMLFAYPEHPDTNEADHIYAVAARCSDCYLLHVEVWEVEPGGSHNLR